MKARNFLIFLLILIFTALLVFGAYKFGAFDKFIPLFEDKLSFLHKTDSSAEAANADASESRTVHNGEADTVAFDEKELLADTMLSVELSVKEDSFVPPLFEAGKYINQFMPDEKALSSLLMRLSNWLPDNEGDLPALQFFPPEDLAGYTAFPVKEDEPSFFVFSPETSGLYTLYIANEDRRLVKEHAFVALFLDDGELKQVSLDYTSDRPAVEITLSDREVYYVLTGFFQLDEESADNARYLALKRGSL